MLDNVQKLVIMFIITLLNFTKYTSFTEGYMQYQKIDEIHYLQAHFLTSNYVHCSTKIYQIPILEGHHLIFRLYWSVKLWHY